jgi:SAM-dependent methyltransferase
MTFAVAGAGPSAYERHLVPALFRPLAQAMVAAAWPLWGRRVLDVACGTGVVARLATAVTSTVTGVDVNPAMLAEARRIEPQITWLEGDATALPLPDASFDVAFCQQGLQFLARPEAALGELRRVLAPAGRLAVALWCELSRAPGFERYAMVLDEHAGPSIGDIMRRPFALGEAGRVRAMLASAGFTQVQHAIRIVPVRFPSVAAFFERQAEASPLAEPVAALPAATRHAMLEALTADLATRVDDEGLTFPIESHIFTAGIGSTARR